MRSFKIHSEWAEMNRLPLARKTLRWESRLRPVWVRLTQRLRRRRLRRELKLVAAEFRGIERLRALVEQGAGVLITPNHAGHPDPFLLCDVADEVGRPFHFMTAWQVFAMQGRIAQRAMQWYGCFSVDREGTDLQALKQAIGILSKGANPLVIFPEGVEVSRVASLGSCPGLACRGSVSSRRNRGLTQPDRHPDVCARFWRDRLVRVRDYCLLLIIRVARQPSVEPRVSASMVRDPAISPLASWD